MSDDQSENAPAAKPRRRDAVREKAKQLSVRQKRIRIIRRLAVVIIALAVLVAIVLVVTVGISSRATRPQLSPRTTGSDGFEVASVEGVSVPENSVTEETPEAEDPEPVASASASAVPVVDIQIYLDYLSPEAREFQLTNSTQLAGWVSSGAATLEYHPVATLTGKSNGTKYSQRAAAAAACVGTNSPDYFLAFTNALFTEQPELDSDGFTDVELAALAIASGAEPPKQVRSCIEDGLYFSWARAATDRALEELPGTDGLALADMPTVLINGQQYIGALNDPEELSQFVLTLSADAYYGTPTPTPSPTTAATETPAPAETPEG